MNIIEVKNLSKYYYQYKVFFKGKLLAKALKDVSFNVKKGDFFGLIGVNGAGKSTLLRILSTNMKKSFGEVYVNGHDMDREENKVKEDISWMFGIDYSGIGWSSLEKNMHMAAAFVGLNKDDATKRVNELINKFDLKKKRDSDVWRLSSGMAAKYSLAVALLKRPKVLFLDEPLLGLDVEAKDQVRELLKEINEQGTTIIYTDHQLQEVEKVCKNIAIINKGELVYQGSTESVKRKHRNTDILEIGCYGKGIMKTVHALEDKFNYVFDCDLSHSEEDFHQLKIFTSIDSKKAMLPVADFMRKNGFIIEQMNAGYLSLEDVFRKFLKKDEHEERAKRIKHFKTVCETPDKKFLEYLKHPHHSVKGAACEVFWGNNKRKVSPIIHAMLSSSKNERQEALRVIGEIKDDCFLEHVLDALEDANSEIQIQAYITLGKFGNEISAKPLVKLLMTDETVDMVLDHIEDIDDKVVWRVKGIIMHLPSSDKEFIQYHIKRRRNANELLELLDLQHANIFQALMEKKEKSMIRKKV